MRRLQVPEEEMLARVHIRAVLPAGGATEVRERAQDLRREQRDEAPKRAPPPPEGGRRELPRLRSGGAGEGPRVRLRGRHLLPAEAGGATAEGTGRGQRRPHPLRLQRGGAAAPRGASGDGGSAPRPPPENGKRWRNISSTAWAAVPLPLPMG